MNGSSKMRIGLLVTGVAVLVILPFVLLGETFAKPFLGDGSLGAGWLVAAAVLLLSSDALLPVPSSWVVMYVAHETNAVVGILAGTVGLSVGVLVAGFIGRKAVGPVASRMLSADELTRLHHGIERRLVLTLACLRCVPVLAEVSVIIAAAGKVPIRRILLVTYLPNLALAIIYSLSARDSFAGGIAAFLATVAISYGAWRLLTRRRSR